MIPVPVPVNGTTAISSRGTAASTGPTATPNDTNIPTSNERKQIDG